MIVVVHENLGESPLPWKFPVGNVDDFQWKFLVGNVDDVLRSGVNCLISQFCRPCLNDTKIRVHMHLFSGSNELSEACQKPQPPLLLKNVSQHTSHLYCNTPPICIAVLLAP